MSEEYKLSHLKELEAESIHIIREVAAEFENPVMLYSIGKDSSVMVRLAEKAFAPGKVPFPLMHIDSKWKFKEMIQFRDEYAKRLCLMHSTNINSMQHSVVHAATRKSHVQKNVYSPSEMNSTSGTLKTSVLSFGTFIMPASEKEKASVCSL